MRLDELNWQPPSDGKKNKAIADVGAIRVVARNDGTYFINPCYVGSYIRYDDLDPCAAQAVLYHLLSTHKDNEDAGDERREDISRHTG